MSNQKASQMARRYECVQRGIHWGVRDNNNPNSPSGAILDLVPHCGGIRIQWRPSTDDWVPSSLVRQSLSDSHVGKIWKKLVEKINESAIARRSARGGTGGHEDLYHDFDDKYDVRGVAGTFNCESLVSLLLTGRSTPVLGKLVSDLGIPPELIIKVGGSSST